MLNVAYSTQVPLLFNIIPDYIVDAFVPFCHKFKKFHCRKIGLLTGDEMCATFRCSNNIRLNAVWAAEAACVTLSIQK
jgi:hypothetical protein